MVREYRFGNARLTDLKPWSRRLAEHRVRISTTTGERVAAVRLYVDLLKSIVELTESRSATGLPQQPGDVLAAKIHLAEAELWLSEVGVSAE